jgi:TolB-like protein
LSRFARQGGEWSTVTRSLFLYLLVAWLLVRYGASAEAGISPTELVSLAILAGFPVAALVASRLGRGASSGRWSVVAVAVAIAALPPLVCMQLQNEHSHQDEIVLTPVVAGADALANADLSRVHEGLRLRVRGLSVKYPGEDGEFADGSAAEILLVTSVREGSAGEELVISATLVSSESGSVIWREEYTANPRDLVAVRRLLIRALTEAMSLTREGVSGGQIV